jgi:ubiquinone/menaquinone biosynthesis C-methylase UbiE
MYSHMGDNRNNRQRPTSADLAQLAHKEAQVWQGSVYYEDAEKWTHLFWNPKGNFLPLFEKMDLSRTLELACGHARHAEYLLSTYGQKIERLFLTDILPSNIHYCMSRIGSHEKVSLFINNGIDFQPMSDKSLTALFCYDAMVHFDRDVVRAYLRDTARVLASGGKALFHHSNYSERPDTSFGQNPHARAYMSTSLFREYAEAENLMVLAQHGFRWGQVENLDALTLIQKSN